jgi:hypothetical protein
VGGLDGGVTPTGFYSRPQVAAPALSNRGLEGDPPRLRFAKYNQPRIWNCWPRELCGGDPVGRVLPYRLLWIAKVWQGAGSGFHLGKAIGPLQLTKGLDKVVNALELAVDGGEADVGDFAQRLKLLEH